MLVRRAACERPPPAGASSAVHPPRPRAPRRRGANNLGQLGSAPYDDSAHPTPEAVAGGVAGATSVTAGDAFACAWAAGTGSAWCWGSNDFGQLGNGDTGGATAAAPVADPVGGAPVLWAQLAAFFQHACGLDTTGAAFCWGDPLLVGAGAPTPATANVPAPVAAAPGQSWAWARLSTGCRTQTTVAVAGAAGGASIYGWGARRARPPAPAQSPSPAPRPHAARPAPPRPPRAGSVDMYQLGNGVASAGGSDKAFEPVRAGVPPCTGVACAGADECRTCGPTTGACDVDAPNGTPCTGAVSRRRGLLLPACARRRGLLVPLQNTCSDGTCQAGCPLT